MGSVTGIVTGVVEEGEVPLLTNTTETAMEDPEPKPRSAVYPCVMIIGVVTPTSLVESALQSKHPQEED